MILNFFMGLIITSNNLILGCMILIPTNKEIYGYTMNKYIGKLTLIAKLIFISEKPYHNIVILSKSLNAIFKCPFFQNHLIS